MATIFTIIGVIIMVLISQKTSPLSLKNSKLNDFFKPIYQGIMILTYGWFLILTIATGSLSILDFLSNHQLVYLIATCLILLIGGGIKLKPLWLNILIFIIGFLGFLVIAIEIYYPNIHYWEELTRFTNLNNHFLSYFLVLFIFNERFLVIKAIDEEISTIKEFILAILISGLLIALMLIDHLTISCWEAYHDLLIRSSFFHQKSALLNALNLIIFILIVFYKGCLYYQGLNKYSTSQATAKTASISYLLVISLGVFLVIYYQGLLYYFWLIAFFLLGLLSINLLIIPFKAGHHDS